MHNTLREERYLPCDPSIAYPRDLGQHTDREGASEHIHSYSSRSICRRRRFASPSRLLIRCLPNSRPISHRRRLLPPKNHISHDIEESVRGTFVAVGLSDNLPLHPAIGLHVSHTWIPIDHACERVRGKVTIAGPFRYRHALRAATHRTSFSDHSGRQASGRHTKRRSGALRQASVAFGLEDRTLL